MEKQEILDLLGAKLYEAIEELKEHDVQVDNAGIVVQVAVDEGHGARAMSCFPKEQDDDNAAMFMEAGLTLVMRGAFSPPSFGWSMN